MHLPAPSLASALPSNRWTRANLECTGNRNFEFEVLNVSSMLTISFAIWLMSIEKWPFHIREHGVWNLHCLVAVSGKPKFPEAFLRCEAWDLWTFSKACAEFSAQTWTCLGAGQTAKVGTAGP